MDEPLLRCRCAFRCGGRLDVPSTVTASLWMGCGASTRRPRQPPDLEPERAPPPESPSKVDETAAAADQGDQLPSPRPKAAGPGDGATVQDDWDDWDEEEADEATAEEAEVSAVRVVQPSGAVACAKGGGSALLCGSALDSAVNARLSCTSCGYRVLRLPHSRWAPDVDYYWMRNFCPDGRMPGRWDEDLAKLCAKLVADDEAAAYACGCSWQSVVGEKELGGAGGTPAMPHGGARLENCEAQLLNWVVSYS